MSTPHSDSDWLREEYLARRNKNPHYTLRAFAQKLKIPPGRLSEVLSGKRRLTYALADKISLSLNYSPEERASLFQRLSELKNTNPRKSSQPVSYQTPYNTIDEDTFRTIADWHHFAILNLLLTKSCKSDTTWIARRLGISATEVSSAITRLCRLGLMTIEKGEYRRTSNKLSTTYEVPSAAIRRSHAQSLGQAIEAIEEVPLPLRDITSITFPADVSKIPQVKAEIKKFQRRMASLMENSDSSEVYNLNVQLVPVTKPMGGFHDQLS